MSANTLTAKAIHTARVISITINATEKNAQLIPIQRHKFFNEKKQYSENGSITKSISEKIFLCAKVVLMSYNAKWVISVCDESCTN
jgi:hypothetical protein